MTISINDIHNDLLEGFQYFLSQEKPDLLSADIDSLAKHFADDNAEELFYLNLSRTGELFGDDVQKVYGLSGHCRLWICKMTDNSFQVGFDVGNGWYAPIDIALDL